MISLRSNSEVELIRRAGRIVGSTLEILRKAIRPGVSTKELDNIAREEILRQDGYPAFKNYRSFPGNICTSINEAIVHGVPSSRRVKKGDIISIDIGVKFREYYADAAITVPVGEVSPEAQRLIRVTKDALYAGIENARPGKRLSDLSSSIQRLVESNGFSVVRAFVGHGIGREIHEEPEIPNYGKPGIGPRLERGMVLAIEPMVNAGTFEIEVLNDGWTAVTKDRKLSAHFEHTITVTDNDPEVLTDVP